MVRRTLLSTVWLVFLLVSPAWSPPGNTAAASPTTLWLEPGATVDRSQPAPGEVRFPVYLHQGARITGSVDQAGVDVSLGVLDPAGNPMAYMDLLTGPRETDAITIAAESSGNYTFVVKLPAHLQPAAGYRFRLSPVHPAQRADWMLNQANRKMAVVVEACDADTDPAVPESQFQALRDAERVFHFVGAERAAFMALSVRARCHYFNEQYEASLAAYQEAAALCEALQLGGCSANLGISIGRLYRTLGQPQKALEAFLNAIRRAEAEQTPSTQITALVDLAALYSWLGDTANALPRIDQAEALMRSAGAEPNRAVLQTLGTILLENDRFAAASARLQQALDQIPQGAPNAAYGMILLRLGEVALRQSNLQQAEIHLVDAAGVFEEIVHPVGGMESHLLLGRTLDAEGRMEEAWGHLTKGLELAEYLGDAHAEIEALFLQAEHEHRQGRFHASLERLADAEARAERLLSQKQVLYLRELSTASLAPLYRLTIDVLMHLDQQEPGRGYARRAFETSERSRVRALLTMLQTRNLADHHATAEQIALRAALRREIEGLIQSLRIDPQEDAAKHSALLYAQFKLQTLQEEIFAQNPSYPRLLAMEAVTVEQIQQEILDPNTVLLEYSLGDERSFLWKVTQDSFQTFELPARQVIESRARETYALLIAPGETTTKNGVSTWDAVKRAKSQYPSVARKLSEMLLGPALEEITDEQRLLVSAEGALLYIPVAALPDPRYTGRKPSWEPILLRNEVGYLPSAASVPLLRRTPWQLPKAPRVTLVTDPVYSLTDSRVLDLSDAVTRNSHHLLAPRRGLSPTPQRQSIDLHNLPRLPGSATEGNSIRAGEGSALFTLLEGHQATLRQILGPPLESADIVHFAVHGLLDDRNPLLSGLALSSVDRNGNAIDGFLSLHAISNLQSQAQLVTLSACRTALGKEIQGEGLIGLTRGFLYAGVPRVVASLWQVGDQQTADLMPRFYQRMLQQGERPGEALRQAQIEIWQQEEDGSSPYNWAAFIVQGDWQ